MQRSYFQKYLDIAPFSLALWRSLEAQELARVKRKYKYKGPILDLGCGFGEFSGVFFNSQIEVGIDISPTDLLQAAKGKTYKSLQVQDARKLTLKSNSINTVISISVLEHIPNVSKAIKEAFRVLKPKGLFIITIPTSKFYTHLFYPRVLEKLGQPKLARLYYRSINRAFKHINLWPEKKWLQLIKKVGFKILESTPCISPASTSVFDIFLLTALPSQIGRSLFGKRFVWGLNWKTKLLTPFYQKLSKTKDKSGSNLIIVAQKL